MKPGFTLGLLSCFTQKRHRGIGGSSPEQKDSDNTNQTSELITGLARKRSDSVSASSNHFSSALLKRANRWRRAPSQPFRGQARERSRRVSSQVPCQSYQRNRPAGLVLTGD